MPMTGEDIELVTCESCGGEYDPADCCEECETCSGCDHMFTIDSMAPPPDGNGHLYCEPCYARFYFTCEQCENDFDMDYRMYDRFRDRYVCDGCWTPGQPAEQRRFCHTCNTYADKLNPVTERFECAHEREQRQASFFAKLQTHLATAATAPQQLRMEVAA